MSGNWETVVTKKQKSVINGKVSKNLPPKPEPLKMEDICKYIFAYVAGDYNY